MLFGILDVLMLVRMRVLVRMAVLEIPVLVGMFMLVSVLVFMFDIASQNKHSSGCFIEVYVLLPYAEVVSVLRAFGSAWAAPLEGAIRGGPGRPGAARSPDGIPGEAAPLDAA